jgi:hypothetical protein
MNLRFNLKETVDAANEDLKGPELDVQLLCSVLTIDKSKPQRVASFQSMRTKSPTMLIFLRTKSLVFLLIRNNFDH